jgi:tetratricopeptide (TPR) repeat protein
MTAEIPNELWRSLFRQAARSQPPPDGEHPVQDEELLTCWSAGQLPDEQHAAVVEHLSQCSPCRRELAELIEACLLQLPPPPASPQGDEEPEPIVAAVLRPRRFWRRVRTWGLGLAVAASLLIALALFLLPRDPGTDLARAEQDAYEAARAELEAGHYDRVVELIGKAADQGIDSGRLANLKLQAERKLPSETALASAGTLLAYGYDLGGVNPDKALPVLDKQTKELLKQWEEAVKRHPQDAKLQENYGQFLLTLGRLEPARRHFEEAARLDTRDADARIGLGLVAFLAEEYDGALKQFEEALRLAPDSVAAHLNAAICLEKLQRPADARRHRRRALELTGDAGLRKQIEAFDKAGKQQP